MQPPLTREFKPVRSKPCFCGSGLRFKDCCGSLAANRLPPHGVHVVHDFIGIRDRETLLKGLQDRPRKPLGTIMQPGDSEFMEAEYGPGRVTDEVDPGDLQHSLNDLVKRAFEERIRPRVGQPFAWFERPQVLRYEPGGRYATHADSELYIKQALSWLKNIDRDISLLIYLNDDFDGGALLFDKFNYTYRPQAGDLLFFPSDHRYMHQAMPVTEGLRWVIVSWAAFADEPKVLEEPTPESIQLD